VAVVAVAVVVVVAGSLVGVKVWVVEEVAVVDPITTTLWQMNEPKTLMQSLSSSQSSIPNAHSFTSR
jgi:hypothetical protein